MQIHGPSEITDLVEVRNNPAGGFVAVEVGSVSIYLYTPAEADRLVRAAQAAKDLLTGVPGHPFTRPGQVSAGSPAPDACMTCGQPASAHGGAS